MCEVAARLQAVLRHNPKKARPSCRKKKPAVDRVDTPCAMKHEVKLEPAPSRDGSGSMCREVWEVESDSDLEVILLEPRVEMSDASVTW